MQTLPLSRPTSRPTRDVVSGCNWQRWAICPSGSPAHLWWITDVLKLARNANRIGAIFNRFISNTDRIVLLEISLTLVLRMRYVRRRKKLEKTRTRRKYRVRLMLQERTHHGQYHTLFAELRLHNREYFYRYLEFSLYDLITESLAAKKDSSGNIFETSSMQIQSKYLRRWRSQ